MQKNEPRGENYTVVEWKLCGVHITCFFQLKFLFRTPRKVRTPGEYPLSTRLSSDLLALIVARQKPNEEPLANYRLPRF